MEMMPGLIGWTNEQVATEEAQIADEPIADADQPLDRLAAVEFIAEHQRDVDDRQSLQTGNRRATDMLGVGHKRAEDHRSAVCENPVPPCPFGIVDDQFQSLAAETRS